MPIAVLSARRPSRHLPQENRLDALFPGGREAFDYNLPAKSGGGLWDAFFRRADKALHLLQGAGHRLGLSLWRRAAIRQTLKWIIKHQEADGAWGGIQPPWIYSLLALHIEGYTFDHPALAKGLGALNDPGWRVDEGEATFIQSTNSAVWDTMLTLAAFHDAELLEDFPNEVERAVQWLLARQVRVQGDWSVKLPHVKPGGWCFEYANNFYPDTDDTAVALIALAPFRKDPKWKAKGIEDAIQLGVNWLIGMQSRCGGWGAFDKDNNKTLLTKIAFCDYGEAIDPPSADNTAHIVEAFATLGIGRDHPSMVRALDYLKREQEPGGAWFGRWGVNYIYGTWQVACGLKTVGIDMNQPWMQKAGAWLRSVQKQDGSFGESADTYEDPSVKGSGPSTASQTAWGTMALMAIYGPEDTGVLRGIRYLIDTQLPSGTWEEPWFTGTGFPRVFYLRYHLYRLYFPIMCLGRWLRESSSQW